MFVYILVSYANDYLLRNEVYMLCIKYFAQRECNFVNDISMSEINNNYI